MFERSDGKYKREFISLSLDLEMRISVECHAYPALSVPSYCTVFLISGLVLYPIRMALAVNLVPVFSVIGFS